jgi:hypothetical protein
MYWHIPISFLMVVKIITERNFQYYFISPSPQLFIQVIKNWDTKKVKQPSIQMHEPQCKLFFCLCSCRKWGKFFHILRSQERRLREIFPRVVGMRTSPYFVIIFTRWCHAFNNCLPSYLAACIHLRERTKAYFLILQREIYDFWCVSFYGPGP